MNSNIYEYGKFYLASNAESASSGSGLSSGTLRAGSKSPIEWINQNVRKSILFMMEKVIPDFGNLGKRFGGNLGPKRERINQGGGLFRTC